MSKRPLRAVVIHRRQEHEAQQAIDDLLKRGYAIIGPLKRVNINLWMAKMEKCE